MDSDGNIDDGGLARDNMTVRDEFAARAMQALIRIGTNEPRDVKDCNGGTFEHPDAPYYFADDIHESRLSADAYAIADAMLEARKR